MTVLISVCNISFKKQNDNKKRNKIKCITVGKLGSAYLSFSDVNYLIRGFQIVTIETKKVVHSNVKTVPYLFLLNNKRKYYFFLSYLHKGAGIWKLNEVKETECHIQMACICKKLKDCKPMSLIFLDTFILRQYSWGVES